MTHYKPIIWVEGIIGAGKSTFAKYLAEKLEFRLLSEPVDNEYLTLFYENPKRWAFPRRATTFSNGAECAGALGQEVSRNRAGRVVVA